MGTALSLAIGVGLAAACGFRVFVPFLALSIAARTGHVALAPGFDWIGTTPALIAFATATAVEALAYSIPWLDHLLDTLATPAAAIAGVVLTASVISDLPPLVRWSFALIAGGGAAGIVQGATVVARLKSTALTAGLGNPFLAAAELIGSAVTSALAILAPLFGLVLVAMVSASVFLLSRQIVFGRRRIS